MLFLYILPLQYAFIILNKNIIKLEFIQINEKLSEKYYTHQTLKNSK